MKRKLFLSVLLMLFALGASAKKSTKKTKTMYRNALIFAYSAANSVYEDDNIKLSIYNEALWITNKTQKTIFIDPARCFVYHNGVSRPIYTREGKKGNSGKKASESNISTADIFITVAPNTGTETNETCICLLTSDSFYGKYSTIESPNQDFTDFEKRLLNVVNDLVNESLIEDPKGKNYLGSATRHFTEDESVNNLGASIAYAYNKDAKEWTNAAISTWVSDVTFAPYYIKMPDKISGKEKRGFGIKETSPLQIHIKANSPFEFDKDKSPIIVSDWQGNFTRGEFKLTPIKVSKTTGKTAAIFGSLLLGPAAAAFIQEKYYKDIILFEGAKADWGEMKYSININPQCLKQKK